MCEVRNNTYSVAKDDDKPQGELKGMTITTQENLLNEDLTKAICGLSDSIMSLEATATNLRVRLSPLIPDTNPITMPWEIDKIASLESKVVNEVNTLSNRVENVISRLNAVIREVQV